MFKQTRTLVYMSFLTALSIVLSRMLSFRFSIGGIEGIRIGLGGLPIIYAGMVFGPMYGGIVGAVADIVGFLLNPMGSYAPHFTLTAFLTGYIPGAVMHYLFTNRNRYWMRVVAILLGQGITDILLVPLFLNHLFKIPLTATAITKTVAVLIETPFYAYFIGVIQEFTQARLPVAAGKQNK